MEEAVDQTLFFCQGRKMQSGNETRGYPVCSGIDGGVRGIGNRSRTPTCVLVQVHSLFSSSDLPPSPPTPTAFTGEPQQSVNVFSPSRRTTVQFPVNFAQKQCDIKDRAGQSVQHAVVAGLTCFPPSLQVA